MKFLDVARSGVVLVISTLFVSYYAKYYSSCGDIVKAMETAGDVDCFTEYSLEYGPLTCVSGHKLASCSDGYGVCNLECVCNTIMTTCTYNTNGLHPMGTCTRPFDSSQAKCKYAPWAAGVKDMVSGASAPVLAFIVFWVLLMCILLVQFLGSLAGAEMNTSPACGILIIWIGIFICDLWTIIRAHMELREYEDDGISFYDLTGSKDFIPLQHAVLMIGTFIAIVIPAAGMTLDGRENKLSFGVASFLSIVWSAICLWMYVCYYHAAQDLVRNMKAGPSPLPDNDYWTYSPTRAPTYFEGTIRYMPLMEEPENMGESDYPPVMFFVVMYALLLTAYIVQAFASWGMSGMASQAQQQNRKKIEEDKKALALIAAMCFSVAFFCLSVADLWYMHGSMHLLDEEFTNSKLIRYFGIYQGIVWMFEFYIFVLLPWSYVDLSAFKIAKPCLGERLVVDDVGQLRRGEPSLENPSVQEVEGAEAGAAPIYVRQISPTMDGVPPAYANIEIAPPAVAKFEKPGPLKVWTASDVGHFVSEIGKIYGPHGETLTANGIDGKMIADGFVKCEDLEGLGLSTFHARIVLRKCLENKEEDIPEPAAGEQKDVN